MRNKEQESKKGVNLRNFPISKMEVDKLPVGFHFHPFQNRSTRRTKIKNSNNRKSGLGRLVRKQFIYSKEYHEYKREIEAGVSLKRYDELYSILYNNFGKLRKSFYKIGIVENRQITYTPLELKYIAESKERIKKAQEEIDKKASSDAKEL